MDDYIKRKIRHNEDELKGQSLSYTQTEPQIIIRQSRQQIRQLLLKINIIQQRANTIKNRLMQIQLKANQLDFKDNPVLERPSMQKPQREDQLPNRSSSTPNKNVQESQKLGSVERVAVKRDAKQTRRQNTDANSQKLQQSGKGIGKTRKIRKLI